MSKNKMLAMVTLAASLLLGACYTEEKQSAAAKPETPSAKTYVVSFDASYAPLEYEEDGKVVGFSPDILSAIAEKEGLTFHFRNAPWEGIFATLDTGDSDVISSSVTITDERKERFDFSDPYFEATQMIVVGPKKVNIKSLEDLKNSTVSVQTGTTGDLVMQKLQGQNSSKIRRFEAMPLALKELSNGGVDAVVGDNAVIQNYVNNHPNEELRTLVDNSFEKEYYGFVVKKGRADDLLARINAGLKAIREDGTYDKIYAKWFEKK